LIEASAARGMKKSSTRYRKAPRVGGTHGDTSARRNQHKKELAVAGCTSRPSISYRAAGGGRVKRRNPGSHKQRALTKKLLSREQVGQRRLGCWTRCLCSCSRTRSWPRRGCCLYRASSRCGLKARGGSKSTETRGGSGSTRGPRKLRGARTGRRGA
jgi:hypothetical protein